MSGDAKQKFLWLFLPVVVAVAAIGGYWFWLHSPHARDRSYAKEHPIGFLAANSAGEAMLQLDVCLLQYALVKGDDAFPEDNDAAVVWTNLSEGYLYLYRPEHNATPAHFTLLARPVHVGIAGVDAPIRRIRHYFLNETGSVHTTFLGREATALDPEVSSCERSGEGCDRVWVDPPTGSNP